MERAMLFNEPKFQSTIYFWIVDYQRNIEHKVDLMLLTKRRTIIFTSRPRVFAQSITTSKNYNC